MNIQNDIASFPILYNTTIGSNREKQWSIHVFDNGNESYTIQTLNGIVNGKMVKHEQIINEGKNKHKKNETSIKEQALLEAQRKHLQKIKQGYAPKNDLLSNESTVTPKILKPMLATEYKSNKIQFPVFVQPKLDGVRCMIHRNNNEIIFQSRMNTIYEPLNHLLEDINHFFSNMCPSFAKDIILDGELYCHGMPFEKITGIVRRSKNEHPDKHMIQYHIYDCFYHNDKNEIPYSDRYMILKSVFDAHPFKNLILVETKLTKDEKELEHYHKIYTTMEIPYEGIMIRSCQGPYKQQSRSKDLQKYKKFLDEEFEIIGHHEGKGSHKDTPIFECRLQDDPSKTFHVMLQGTISYRKNMMKNITSYYGKFLTVKYQEKSVNGIPRFPVGIEIRDYE